MLSEGLGPDEELAAVDAMVGATARKIAMRALAKKRGEELRRQYVAYGPCISHRHHRYTMAMQASATPAIRMICPVCAGLATNVSGPHLPGFGA